MSDQEFQLEVIDRLGKLNSDVASIRSDVAVVKEHLRTLNGKVAEHEKKIEENRDFMVSERAKQKAGATWVKRLEPIAYVCLTVLVVVVLEHVDAIKKWFSN